MTRINSRHGARHIDYGDVRKLVTAWIGKPGQILTNLCGGFYLACHDARAIRQDDAEFGREPREAHVVLVPSLDRGGRQQKASTQPGRNRPCRTRSHDDSPFVGHRHGGLFPSRDLVVGAIV